jgi:hypothetical protein
MLAQGRLRMPDAGPNVVIDRGAGEDADRLAALAHEIERRCASARAVDRFRRATIILASGRSAGEGVACWYETGHESSEALAMAIHAALSAVDVESTVAAAPLAEFSSRRGGNDAAVLLEVDAGVSVDSVERAACAALTEAAQPVERGRRRGTRDPEARTFDRLDDCAGEFVARRRTRAPSAAPAALRDLLGYLAVSLEEFRVHESRYFGELSRLLRIHGVLSLGETVDAATHAEAVRTFQSRAGLVADGVPGEGTLWRLQVDEAMGNRLGIVKVPAERVAGSDGFDNFRLRSDVAPSYLAFHDAVVGLGGVVTSAGSLRGLDANVSTGRSSTSLHYSGIALDLATDSGMQRPARDACVVEADGKRWRVWCRSDAAAEVELEAVTWSRGAITSSRIGVRAFDLSALAELHGFSRIGPRSSFPGSYMSAEWWHLQATGVLVPYVSQFGIEMVRLHGVAEIERRPALWSSRGRIFRRGKDGWH